MKLNTSGWRPPTPPSLDGIDELAFDVETSSLEWWRQDIMVGLAIGIPDGRNYYLPIRHKGGGNLDEPVLKRWMERELRGKRLRGANIKFDAQVSHNFGIDLEAQGNTLTDVQHYAALLDDTRFTFSLDELGQEFLGEGKVKGIDVTRMAEYHAAEVTEYAERDVELTNRLADVMIPMMREQDLMEVSALEDRVIWPVCEMERNAARLDMGLLNEWVARCKKEIEVIQWKITKETGMQVNPKSPVDMEMMFVALGLPINETTENGHISLAASHLKKIDHPVVKMVLRAVKLKSIFSKYLLAYSKKVVDGNVLRYNLNQLRTSKDDDDSGIVGAVSGRFSSSDINIQQVFNPARQREKMGDDYIIRDLFVPAKGKWLSADAMQVEFRLVSHYAMPAEVIQAYKDDPLTSFHKVVWKMVSEHTDISYKALKDLNFAKVYGAAWKKCTVMMGLSLENDAEKAMGKKFCDAYDVRFPEIKDLLQQASRVATDRGFVKTLTGRRARFPNGWRVHSAVNRIVQGGAGDLMKKKLCEVHEERKRTGFLMRFTVHDDLDGDAPDEESAAMVGEILNRQTTELNVPILWDVKTGERWSDC